MEFYHEYYDESNYVVRGSDGRVYDPCNEAYLIFCKDNLPQKTSGDRFVNIDKGIPKVNPDKQSILLAEQAAADRENKIQAEMVRLLREMAENNLKAKGEI